MAETVTIPVADLLMDAENPRLPEPNVAQRDAIREMAKQQGRKLLTLARDIAENGLNPADLPIVVPDRQDPRRYVVLEGNRRLAALRALENPSTLAGAVSEKTLSELQRLSKKYQQTPVEFVQCLVVKDRDDAAHWIELRHTGQNNGAGIVDWDKHEKERFRARTGAAKPLEVQVLDFLEDKGLLRREQRRKVVLTNLGRLLGTPAVRKKLGIGKKDGRLVLLGDEKRVAKALLHVVKDMSEDGLPVAAIYRKEQRVEYAENLPAHVVVEPTGSAHEVPAQPETGRPAARKRVPLRVAKRRRLRETLIPSDCILAITDPRLLDIAAELRKLKLEDYPNAVSVLLRVFIELSVDAYIEREKLTVSARPDLAEKLNKASEDLVKRQKLTKQQAVPVRRAAQKDSFLAPSVKLMHQWVHNKHVFPAAGDLRAHWDSLQPFLMAIWSQ